MTEAKHSPTPWIADPDDREGMEWNIHILDAKGDRVCFMTSDGPAEINADLIVRSVNALPDLMKALEIARERINYLGIVHIDHKHYEANEKQFLPLIDAALAKVKPMSSQNNSPAQRSTGSWSSDAELIAVCMDMLGDVPGDTLDQRIERLVSAHLGVLAEGTRACEGEKDAIVQLIHKHVGIRQRINVDLTGVEEAAEAIIAERRSPAASGVDPAEALMDLDETRRSLDTCRAYAKHLEGLIRGRSQPECDRSALYEYLGAKLLDLGLYTTEARTIALTDAIRSHFDVRPK
jgi:hypothetical protein